MIAVTPVENGAQTPMRDAWGRNLVELGNEFASVVVLDGDLANSTKADMFAQAHPERFFEMGIAEQNMLGVAAGFASVDFVPWISTFAAFLAKRALDQIRVVIAQPGLNVKMCGSYSGLLAGKTGKTHISVEDIAVFRCMPGVVTIVPADDVELRGAMQAMMDDERPTYLRLVRDPVPTIFPDDYDFKIGQAVRLRGGDDVGIISTGVQTVRALDAARELANDGIQASVLHVPTIKPLDEEAIVALASETGAIVTAEDHSILGGLGGAVAECLAEYHPTRMKRVGLRDVYGESAPNEALLEKYGLTPGHIAEATRALLATHAHAGAAA